MVSSLEPPGSVPGLVPEGLGLLSSAVLPPWRVGEAVKAARRRRRRSWQRQP